MEKKSYLGYVFKPTNLKKSLLILVSFIP